MRMGGKQRKTSEGQSEEKKRRLEEGIEGTVVEGWIDH